MVDVICIVMKYIEDLIGVLMFIEFIKRVEEEIKREACRAFYLFFFFFRNKFNKFNNTVA